MIIFVGAVILIILGVRWFMSTRTPSDADLPCVDRVMWSPHFGSRGNRKVTTLIWHYTAGQGNAARWFQYPEARASAHFVIRRDGTIIQCVKLENSAWHVGKATIDNAQCIGVEIENVGRVKPHPDGGWVFGGKNTVWKPDAEPIQAKLRYDTGKVVDAWWVPYTNAQHTAIRKLLADLERSNWKTCLGDQRGHEDIATPVGRKTDPGPLFPWYIMGTWQCQNKRTTVIYG